MLKETVKYFVSSIDPCNGITMYVKLRIITLYYCLPLLNNEKARRKKAIQNMIEDLLHVRL